MFSLFAFFSSIFISFSGLLAFSSSTIIPSNPLFASVFHFSGNIPTSLGISEDQLAPCPDSPNCVVSQTNDETHFIEPLSYQSDRQKAYNDFVKILSVVPETEIVEQTENYIRTKSTSKIMGFVDDAEFYFPVDKKIIHWRSASRLGESDLGVNRRRLEQIRFAFNDFSNDK